MACAIDVFDYPRLGVLKLLYYASTSPALSCNLDAAHKERESAKLLYLISSSLLTCHHSRRGSLLGRVANRCRDCRGFRVRSPKPQALNLDWPTCGTLAGGRVLYFRRTGAWAAAPWLFLPSSAARSRAFYFVGVVRTDRRLQTVPLYWIRSPTTPLPNPWDPIAASNEMDQSQ
jgi:hypothetical protein